MDNFPDYLEPFVVTELTSEEIVEECRAARARLTTQFNERRRAIMALSPRDGKLKLPNPITFMIFGGSVTRKTISAELNRIYESTGGVSYEKDLYPSGMDDSEYVWVSVPEEGADANNYRVQLAVLN